MRAVRKSRSCSGPVCSTARGRLSISHASRGAARRRGCIVGFDLAHSIGNVPLALHDSDADFAVWCSYKYLNAGPGAIAGASCTSATPQRRFLPRLAGWWGHEPATRFKMLPGFTASAGAAGWQVSNPPILSSAPLLASLELFQEAGMERLRSKSRELTGFLEGLLDGLDIRVITPAEPEAARLPALAAHHGSRGPRPTRAHRSDGSRRRLRLARARHHPRRSGAALQLALKTCVRIHRAARAGTRRRTPRSMRTRQVHIVGAGLGRRAARDPARAARPSNLALSSDATTRADRRSTGADPSTWRSPRAASLPSIGPTSWVASSLS